MREDFGPTCKIGSDMRYSHKCDSTSRKQESLEIQFVEASVYTKCLLRHQTIQAIRDEEEGSFLLHRLITKLYKVCIELIVSIRSFLKETSFTNAFPQSRSVFDKAVFQSLTMFISYPNVNNLASSKSSRSSAYGQYTLVLLDPQVQVFSRFPINPWTKTILRESNS